ncbi:MAG TPA: hypothetical protein DFR83_03955, partial [Deltaproteobacteria bacterium]|nr:hypothetical protein [Deltaproteobacteria bacterium]
MTNPVHPRCLEGAWPRPSRAPQSIRMFLVGVLFTSACVTEEDKANALIVDGSDEADADTDTDTDT